MERPLERSCGLGLLAVDFVRCRFSRTVVRNGRKPVSDCRPSDAVSRSRVSSDAVEALLRQRMISTARDFSSVQEHLDCAEMAASCGFPDHARRLHRLAGLRIGFGEPCPDASARVFKEPLDRRIDGAAKTGIACAVEELEAMLEVAKPSGAAERPLPHDGYALMPPISPQPVLNGSISTSPVERCDDDATLLDILYDGLRAPSAEGIVALTALIGCMDVNTMALPDLDPAAHIGAELSRLIDVFIASSLRHFLRSKHDLMRAPFGSPQLFYYAARLSRTGLGAWFGNASRTVRDTTDLFGLVQAAAGGPIDRDEQDRWIVRFAATMQGARLHAMVNDLADLGRMRPVWGIFAAAIRKADGAALERDLLLVLRDAGIDNGDTRLAVTAQRIIALQAAESRLEWRILGDICASAGEITSAGEAYAQGLRLAPGDAEITLRLSALHNGSFTPFVVMSGYGEHSRHRRGRRQSVDTVNA